MSRTGELTMSADRELFDIFDIPPCATTSCLHQLRKDLREVASYLKPGAEHRWVCGLNVKPKASLSEKDLTRARRFLREMSDSLARQLNRQFNEEARRRPAVTLQINWPSGADFLDIQEGTAMIRGTLVLLGNRRIAYLGSDMNSFHLASGFYLLADGDRYRVVESPVEEHIENGRAVVRYPRKYWDKSTAWDDLRRRYKVGGRDNNPWRKSHDNYAHGWTAPVDQLPPRTGNSDEAIQAQEA